MQCVRRHHVDDVDVLVGGHAIHGRVVVHALVRDAVLLLPLLGLGRGAGDDAGETAIARLLQRGRDLVGREAAEPDECDAELARRCFGRRCLAREAGQQRCGGEGGGGGEEFAALVTHVTSLKAVADIPARESSRARAPFFSAAEPEFHRALPMPVADTFRGDSACLSVRITFWQQKEFCSRCWCSHWRRAPQETAKDSIRMVSRILSIHPPPRTSSKSRTRSSRRYAPPATSAPTRRKACGSMLPTATP